MDVTHCTPHIDTTLDATAHTDLQQPVALLSTTDALNVSQRVPGGAAADVAIIVQHSTGGLQSLLIQLQLLANAIQHLGATCVSNNKHL